MSIPITDGQGQSSVATEQIGTVKYQQIKVFGGQTGSTSFLGINSVHAAYTAPTGGLVTTEDAQGLVSWGNTATGITNNPAPVGGFLYNGTDWDAWRGTIGGGALVQSGNSSVNAIIQTQSVIASGFSDGVANNPKHPIDNEGQDIYFPNLGYFFNPAIPGFERIRGNSSVGTLVYTTSSILSSPVGSTITVWQVPSIVGTYAEDAAHATGDKGLLKLAVRRDTLASVTSGDGDYSPTAVGPSGEQITANAPLTKWVRGTADMRGVGALGGSVTVIASQGASVFTYITSAQIANIGGASVLVTIAGGLGSTLGYTIAPAGGGSNIYYPNALKTGENSAVTASISGVASILVSLQGFTAGI